MDTALEFPNPGFTSALTDGQQRRLPQCIAHRGFSTKHPENTMAASKAAVQVGAHALEMDLQLTRDGVVVVSHDPFLDSKFGQPGRIADHDWRDIQGLRTIEKPHEPIPRLIDVLNYLSQPGAQHIWILLEIKVGNNANEILQSVKSLLDSMIPAPDTKPWNERIVFTVLPASYLALAAQHLPGYPVAHIGFSRSYVRDLLPIPGLSFNISLPLLIIPGGRRLLAEAQKKHHKPVYAWVVNEETMTWCIRRGLDGVLCDDPQKFLRVCREFDDTVEEPWFVLGLRTYWTALVDVVCMALRAWSARKVLHSK